MPWARGRFWRSRCSACRSGKLPIEAVQRIVAGGHDVCEQVGVPIGGGHSIDSPEPIYGLVALGLIDPAKVKRNDRAQAGDVLILGKALGVGIMSAALKKGELKDKAYQQMLESATQLNTPGHPARGNAGRACVDRRHGLRAARAPARDSAAARSWRRSSISTQVPILSAARHLVRSGLRHRRVRPQLGELRARGRAANGRAGLARGKYSPIPKPAAGCWWPAMRPALPAVLEVFRQEGFQYAARIGTLGVGEPRIVVQ